MAAGGTAPLFLSLPPAQKMTMDHNQMRCFTQVLHLSAFLVLLYSRGHATGGNILLHALVADAWNENVQNTHVCFSTDVIINRHQNHSQLLPRHQLLHSVSLFTHPRPWSHFLLKPKKQKLPSASCLISVLPTDSAFICRRRLSGTSS